MRTAIYFALLAALLLGYYEALGPGPSPSEYVGDLEWWRPWGWAHTWAGLAFLERMAEAEGIVSLLPVFLFWLPPLAMLVWGLRSFESAVARTLCVAGFLLLWILPYYGYRAARVWRFFEWQSVAVAAVFACVVSAAAFAPSLLQAARGRSRIATAGVLVVVFAGVFVISTEITGTDSSMRLNISPWPVVTLFGLLLLGTALACVHLGAGAGLWAASRLGPGGGAGRAGLVAAAVAAPGAAALLALGLGVPGVGAFVGVGLIAALSAVLRSRAAREDDDLAGRARSLLVAGAFVFAAIHVSNQAAQAYQATARNDTATRVLVALEDYRERHGSYPLHLDELTPEFLAEVPRPRMGLILDVDDDFTYSNLGDSYVLEFSSVQWVQCGYSPPYDMSRYSDEDEALPRPDVADSGFDNPFDDGYDEDAFEDETAAAEPSAALADFGLEGAWNCQDEPPRLW